jgi:hypothetical protein
MVAALLAVAAAVWAVSLRTRPAFAVYDSLPVPSRAAPTGSSGAPAALTPAPAPAGDTTAPAPHAPMTAPRPAPTRGRQPRALTASADTARADTAGPGTATADTVRHHRSENYGGYSGYGSRERRGNPNAR